MADDPKTRSTRALVLSRLTTPTVLEEMRAAFAATQLGGTPAAECLLCGSRASEDLWPRWVDRDTPIYVMLCVPCMAHTQQAHPGTALGYALVHVLGLAP